MLKKIFTANSLKSFAILNIGTALMSIGTYFFKFPNNFSTGGVSGIAVIFGAVFSFMTPGGVIFVLNMILLVVGMLVFGKKFGLKTAYASLMMSAQIWVLEKFLPLSSPLTDQPFLELMFAVFLPAVGSAILFNIDASSGGTDVIAMILKKYTNINLGHCLLFSDCLIVVAGFFVFGIQTGLFSLLGLIAKALVVDNVIESINLCKYFTIITSCPDEVCSFIVTELSRGATKIEAQGAFTDKGKTVVLTVVSRGQAILLHKTMKKIDPNAFVLITNTSEIIGKGFRGVL